MSFPLDPDAGRISCRLAVDRSGARHVLVPVEQDDVLQAQRGSALTVEQRDLVFGGTEQSYVDVSCVRSDLYYEFDGVVQDILEAVQDSSDARRSTLDVVSRWRRLFGAAAVRGLSTEARRGLFAELACLQEFLTVDPELSVDGWRGPLREPHDFELSSVCVEVKASGAISEAVRVHGLEQLDLHDDKSLYLAVITVVEDAEGRTIPELAEDLRSAVTDPSLFAGRLLSAGWSDEDPGADSRYLLGAVCVVPVAAGIPRIVRSSLVAGVLPTGVGRVEYSIDRDALVPLAAMSSLTELAAEALA
ncbi:PD-(D/E)XK motif protein [Kribbella sp. HUAS MG21]|uniref:PD-(D/E)XK motif protein n=1 Tax=Kribbella sp. HUAS MG21 TaxID=3160966 RepID=A0AAU7T592_9ACTN